MIRDLHHTGYALCNYQLHPLIRKAVPAVPFDMTNWTYRRLYTCHVYQFIWTFIQVTDSAPSFWPVWTFMVP